MARKMSPAFFWRHIKRWVLEYHKAVPDSDPDVILDNWHDADWEMYLEAGAGPTNFITTEKATLNELYPGAANWIISEIFEREARDKEVVEMDRYNKLKTLMERWLVGWKEMDDDEMIAPIMENLWVLKKMRDDPGSSKKLTRIAGAFLEKYGAQIKVQETVEETRKEVRSLYPDLEEFKRSIRKDLRLIKEEAVEAIKEAKVSRDFPDRPALEKGLAEIEVLIDELKWRGKITDDEIWMARRDSKEEVERILKDIQTGKTDPISGQNFAERRIEEVRDRMYDKVRERIPTEEVGKPRPEAPAEEVPGLPAEIVVRTEIKKLEHELGRRIDSLEHTTRQKWEELKGATERLEQATREAAKARRPGPPPKPKIRVDKDVVGPPMKFRAGRVTMRRSPNAIPCGICGGYFYPWTVEVEEAFKLIPYFPQDRYYFRLCQECKEADRSPVAKHKQIPELCDFVWETIVLGDAYSSRPTLSMEAFTAVGIPEEWVQTCIDSKGYIAEVLKP